jgi:large subunit ribosomal protein L3
MINTLLGSKQHMSQAFVEGTRVPVTWVKAGPCIVTHIKNMEKDGYWAVQLGYGTKKAKNTSKPLKGHLKKIITTKNKQQRTKETYPRFIREVRLDKEPNVKVGDIINLTDIFKKGDVVTITGISKGKGFAGVVKRWGFAGGPRTHGQSDRERAPGSIGQGTTPGRVHKGKKMAGRMGSDRVTIKNLIVVDIKEDEGLLALSGPVPGISRGVLIIRKTGEGKLSELVEEVPQVEIQQVEEAEGEEEEKTSGTEKVEKVEDKEEAGKDVSTEKSESSE